MSYEVLKIAALGSSAVAIGGGLAAGSSAFSGNKSDVIKDSSLTSTEPPKSCVIYEMEEPTPKGNIGNRRFKKIKKKFVGRDAFLEELTKRGDVWNKKELEDKIGAKCDQGKDSYIWWGKGDSRYGETWIYAKDMNEKGINWIEDPDVIKNSKDILNK
ncbi:hypothetical protein MHC_03020 [Mycoplasma haemocanis str. Illinois]|uniref:Uncharacterized protein n=1 Tax=Mycoplasma haemocanis (strain Illinois) TaxID=1111676 RepID=H6N744_MYCHN|nr:hypothetical protein [Mycoplasma haemocanis]AEW45466.1 hypothetical protein MHC_03020 [Mycoplasma haemocanis str. Illinois]